MPFSELKCGPGLYQYTWVTFWLLDLEKGGVVPTSITWTERGERFVTQKKIHVSASAHTQTHFISFSTPFGILKIGWFKKDWIKDYSLIKMWSGYRNTHTQTNRENRNKRRQQLPESGRRESFRNGHFKRNNGLLSRDRASTRQLGREEARGTNIQPLLPPSDLCQGSPLAISNRKTDGKRAPKVW